MIKIGTNVKSKIHDDLTGMVVRLDRSRDWAVVWTDLVEYEMMTVECYLSDLEVCIMTLKQIIKEYVYDHFYHFGFYPYEVEVDGQVYSYGGYWEILEDERFD